MIIDSIFVPRLRLVDSVVRRMVDAQYTRLLERPRRHIGGELLVPRLDTAEGRVRPHNTQCRLCLLGRGHLRVLVAEEVYPAHPGGAAASECLEPSNEAERAPRPETLAALVCSIHKRIGALVFVRVCREALRGRIQNGYNVRVGVEREGDAREPHRRQVRRHDRVRGDVDRNHCRGRVALREVGNKRSARRGQDERELRGQGRQRCPLRPYRNEQVRIL